MEERKKTTEKQTKEKQIKNKRNEMIKEKKEIKEIKSK